MARVTQEHLDARRRQILDAAAREFGLKGLDPGAATIDDIAAAAGLSKGSIYSYFKNKDELFEAIIEAGFERDADFFSGAVEETATSWDAFWQLAGAIWDHMSDPANRERNMLTFDRMLHEVRNGDIDPRYVEHPIGELIGMLAGAQREGRIAEDVSIEVLATALWNLQQGTRAYLLRTGDTEMARATLDLMQDLLVRSAGTASSSGEDAAG